MRRARLVLALALVGAAAGAAVDAGGAGTPACFGAASRDPLRPCENPRLLYTVTPSPKEALDAPNAPCESVAADALPYRCTFGSPPDDAAATVALVGDSHATHWRSAMLTVAARKHWHGISITRSSCPFTQATPLIPDRRGCVSWNHDVVQFIADRPEISTVVVSQHRGRVVTPKGARPREVQVRGYLAAWRALPPSVTSIVVIRDTPYDRTHTGDCIEQALRRHAELGEVCAVPRSSALKSDPAATAARRSTDPRVHLVDMTHYFCGAQLCYPVIGGALVHKDTTHISLTFGTTLGPFLLRKIDALPGR
ncbi:MAG: acyltransferase [Solirubrobacterales bacterium]|nr:acyltransferase [Solirubrobacterales bacterium]